MKVNASKIREIISGLDIDVDLQDLKDNTSFKDIGMDSLDIMNILLVLEETFGVKIPDEDVDQLGSIDTIITYFKER